jgi:predicted dehydrogenase
MVGPALGERIAVIGLGLLGQLGVQLLKAAGCSVFGIDIDGGKVALARELGADDGALPGDGVAERVQAFSRGRGADAVIIFAGASDAAPLELAAEVARERAKIAVPGMIDLRIPRRPFYEKQLELVIPHSAGPGIDDPEYEIGGVDYPFGYVRWTAQRNMEQFLDLAAQGKVRVDPLITHRFDIADGQRAYQMILQGQEKHIGVLFRYPDADVTGRKLLLTEVKASSPRSSARASAKEISLGVIGAGLFARGTLLPLLKKMPGVRLTGVATAGGASSWHAGKKFGFGYSTTDYHALLADPQVQCVLIATRHDLHATMAAEALQKGKDVFLEKPLATTVADLKALSEAHRRSGRQLMVGFNRRFAPFSVRAKELLQGRGEPLLVQCRVNAGTVPMESWVQDPVEGGGRIVGEVCHFVDLVQYFTGSLVQRVSAEAAQAKGDDPMPDDNVVINLRLRDGSAASITYASRGDRAFPRERLELFWGNSICLIDNFRSFLYTHDGRQQRVRRWSLNRGYREELEAFFSAVRQGGEAPISFQEALSTTLTTFCIVESLKTGRVVEVDPGHYGLTP